MLETFDLLINVNFVVKFNFISSFKFATLVRKLQTTKQRGRLFSALTILRGESNAGDLAERAGVRGFLKRIFSR